MTHFRITVDVTCPSNWKAADVETWIGKVLVPAEAATISIADLDALVGAMGNEVGMNLHEYLERQREWSEPTFGLGRRTVGILKHIAKELEEIKANPNDLSEWVDVVILALDGYWRHGGDPETIMGDLAAKQFKNRARKWPPPGPEDEAMEHVRVSV